MIQNDTGVKTSIEGIISYYMMVMMMTLYDTGYDDYMMGISSIYDGDASSDDSRMSCQHTCGIVATSPPIAATKSEKSSIFHEVHNHYLHNSRSNPNDPALKH